ncbi:translation initiation factor IF-2 [Pedobacter heparinus]|uniref:Translation initiation factor IF-2 n=1 Tax=Pedobacter heparinus (strain ATCC 13125 / DSM 2366 / CIP 104194 / JCM 7457 / NBRC 12017 / NCIMB 9290 / NRRL B-14731 / HIM 762-3) TaxID=485917 RepID=C6XYA0_PEDHD|nr:translation initiation factor IF-2 [Pedobacter heparinus]ACU02367.1 translation initiation factor IF-2 [Pedobacter heparinus DSM 2366]
MSDDKPIILFKAVKELNVGIATAVEFLEKKGFSVENKPTTKLSRDMYNALLKEFQGDKIVKEEANQIVIGKIRRDEPEVTEKVTEAPRKNVEFENEGILVKNLHSYTPPAAEKPKEEAPAPVEKPEEKVDEGALPGVKIVGKINLDDLNAKTRPVKKEETPEPEPKAEAALAPVAPVEKAPEPVKEVEKPVEQPVAEIKPEPVKPVETPKAEEQPKPVAEAPVVKTPEPPAAPKVAPEPPKVEKPEENEVIKARSVKLSGPNIIGKITLPVTPDRKSQPVASSGESADAKRKRKRKKTPGGHPGQAGQHGQQGSNQHGGQQSPQQGGQPGAAKPAPTFGNRPDFRNNTNNTANRPNFRNNKPGAPAGGPKEEPTEKEIQDQIKATLARLSGAGKSGKFAQRAKLRRQKRDDVAMSADEAAMEQELQSRVLKVTEFVTANELATMMDEPVTKIIATCMSLGMFVSINQRLDAETLTIVADEFGYEIQFVKPDDESDILIEEEDSEEDLLPRAPVVTIMGHVDHGKTSLLDYIRKANVVAGEAGGITQHIGAYMVTTSTGKKVTFLDTPGHEAFTAMRARGAKVADIAIIVVAADDAVMPQTKEAINHAQAAGVPLVFAFTKIDKPGANSDKIREQLSIMNILVEDWGGNFQSQEISGKSGLNVDLLLEKVLLEAELLDLKANPNKRATGSVIEATLDKGRGIVTTVLVQAGTLKVGDPILAGSYSGRVKALFNERGQKVDKAGPSVPVQVLGMQGAPTAGDRFNALESEVEAREIANKRLQLMREQGLRTQKHITLDEIGRRLAIGNFKELNLIVKGDVDGSIEALSDSLLKLSTPEIQINIIGKAVGQISESDVLLASASDAIIVGFQVRPSPGARKLAEAEQIDIRLYSIIYDAINEIKAAMEGMLAPEFEEKITANVEIRETFKITKVGTIAGCMVLDGTITRNSKIRIVRDGVVIYTGELASLKRYKDDVKEVSRGYECGLNIQNFNNIEVGDIVEAYEQVEVKRKL